MKFEWDEKKNRLNIKKHKLSFVQAVPAFSDPHRTEYYDGSHSSLEEDRFLLYGIAESRVLVISFTEPDNETVHIISARWAENHEVEDYYGNS